MYDVCMYECVAYDALKNVLTKSAEWIRGKCHWIYSRFSLFLSLTHLNHLPQFEFQNDKCGNT